MAYKIGHSIPASTDNVGKHHAVLMVGSAAGKTAGVTFYGSDGGTGASAILYSGAETTVIPVQIKNTGVLDGITLYGLV
ncbi:MAG: hypothetical protein H8D80_00150 [Proteobacteria bacterium]|nr:hypothetical protein [Pseudomonadota bacterium]